MPPKSPSKLIPPRMPRRKTRPAIGQDWIWYFYSDPCPQRVEFLLCADFAGGNSKRIAPKAVADQRRK